METSIAALEQAFIDYRRELEECARKQKPAAGLFGIGHSIKDDACHDRFDEKIRVIIEKTAAEHPSSDEAKQIIQILYSESERYDYPVSGRLMLVAEERHILLLTAFLSREDAAALADEYGRRYRRQNRLPAQNQVLAALKERAKGKD